MNTDNYSPQEQILRAARAFLAISARMLAYSAIVVMAIAYKRVDPPESP